MKHPVYSDRVIAEKRVLARDLIYIKGYTQKEAADQVGVTQKTMCNWLKKFKSNDQAGEKVRKMGGLNIVMDEFFSHLEANEGPIIRGLVKQQWIDFVSKL